MDLNDIRSLVTLVSFVLFLAESLRYAYLSESRIVPLALGCAGLAWCVRDFYVGVLGFDVILDDPRTFNALMSGRRLSSAPPELVFYLLVRHALLEDGITDRSLADYLAALIATFITTRKERNGMSTTALPEFDPADADANLDPYPLFARLRAERPV